jgi:hypothetical protein
MYKVNNVFEAILKYGHDEDFAPAAESEQFRPTDAPAGSQAKIDVLRRRVELGLPLWHEEDRRWRVAVTSGVDALKHQVTAKSPAHGRARFLRGSASKLPRGPIDSGTTTPVPRLQYYGAATVTCSCGARGSNSSRRTSTSGGASMPNRTLSPDTRTTVTTIDFPSLIRSFSLRDSTSISQTSLMVIN